MLTAQRPQNGGDRAKHEVRGEKHRNRREVDALVRGNFIHWEFVPQHLEDLVILCRRHISTGK